MPDVVLYVEIGELDEQEQAAFLGEAAQAGFAVDELYGSMGAESQIVLVLSTMLNSVVTKLAEEAGTVAGDKLSRLLRPLFNRKDHELAIEDRETRITFVWDAQARKELKVAAAALIDVGNSLHMISDRTVLRWDASAQRWQAATK